MVKKRNEEIVRKREEFRELSEKGSLLIQQEKYNEALPVLEKAVKLGEELRIRRDDLGQLINNRGICLMKIGKFKAAQEDFEEAEKLIKKGSFNKIRAYLNLAISYGRDPEAKNKEELARKAISSLEKAEEEFKQLWLKKQKILGNGKKFGEIKEMAIKLYTERGDCHFQLEEYSKAAQFYQTALKWTSDPRIEMRLALVKLEEAGALERETKEGKAAEKNKKIVKERRKEAIEILKFWIEREDIENEIRDKGLAILVDTCCKEGEIELAIQGFKSLLRMEKETSIEELVEKLEETELREDISELIPSFGYILLIKAQSEKEYRLAERIFKKGLMLEKSLERKAGILGNLVVCQIEIIKLIEDPREIEERCQEANKFLQEARKLRLEEEKIRILAEEIIKIEKEIKKKLVPPAVEVVASEVPDEKAKWLTEEEELEKKMERIFRVSLQEPRRKGQKRNRIRG
ncbi:MAG: hypothetical protein QME61_04175 [Patescibacteria group bacterium]|nr:hypothetical protein [Patescibacteria group bacterium]